MMAESLALEWLQRWYMDLDRLLAFGSELTSGSGQHPLHHRHRCDGGLRHIE